MNTYLAIYSLFVLAILITNKFGKIDVLVKEYNSMKKRYKIAAFFIMLPNAMFMSTFGGAYFCYSMYTDLVKNRYVHNNELSTPRW